MQQEPYQPQFWEERDPQERARQAWNYVAALEDALLTDQVSRDNQAIQLYEGDERDDSNQGQTVTNTIQQAVDAFVADVIRQRVKIQFLTESGHSDEREQAIQISRALEGQFDDWGLYGDLGTEICRDGFVCPSGGAVKLTVDYQAKRLLLERIEGCHVLCDPREALLSEPQTKALVGDISIDILKARSPHLAAELEECESANFDSLHTGHSVKQIDLRGRRTRVYEVWHKPSSDVDSREDRNWGIGGGDERERKVFPDHDGWHLLMAGPYNGKPLVLQDEPWPIQQIPVLQFQPIKRMRGPYGHSPVERLQRTQLLIDQWQDRIDACLNLYSRPIFYINTEAGIKPETAATNDWSRMFVGNKPPSEAMQQFTPNTIPPDLLQRVHELIEWTRDAIGKNELSMMGQKPAGVESGIALRTLRDEESARHTTIYRAWESYMLAIARPTIEMWRLLAAKDKDFAVTWGTDTELARQKWSKIDLDNQRFKMRPWPTSLFSSSPAAKLEQMIELIQTLGVDNSKALPLLVAQFPDLGALFRDENAFMKNIEKRLNAIMRDGELRQENMPHAFMNKEMAKQMSLARYNAAEADDEKDGAVRGLGEFIQLVFQLPDAPPAPPAPAGAEGGPPVPPALPPPPSAGVPSISGEPAAPPPPMAA